MKCNAVDGLFTKSSTFCVPLVVNNVERLYNMFIFIFEPLFLARLLTDIIPKLVRCSCLNYTKENDKKRGLGK
jgi:hypothetical protein